MIRFQLITLAGTKINEDVFQVTLPTKTGRIGVLERHMPLVGVITPGIIEIQKNEHDAGNKTMQFVTYGGVIEIANNVLRVIVDEADQADEINESEAQRAYERAQKMKLEARDEISLENAQALIDRSRIRLQVVKLRRRSSR
ncbi:MAG TPA: ATP synthase F1 subunit epsilon [Candidatus Saccharimonadales bacterium]|jgi:F-type H+-transporting ATPase subunit epsilon|nr:ATP synthase F1 subunit epsilon [Candidatus Saccharimonadales bacterium]